MDSASFTANASGRLVTHDGNAAFVPAPLPPALDFTPELVTSLSEAARSVGLLAGRGHNLAGRTQ